MATSRSTSSRLKPLQAKINTDTRARNTFLKDPGAVLRREGVELTPQRERELKAFIDKQTSLAGGRISGARVFPGAANRVEVEVTVKVRF